MANVFSRTNEVNNHPKRNTYDLSFQNNLTGKFGALYPVLFQPVIPGNSCKIKPTFALQFMPMTFPVQTRMRAHLHFFYVRRRNLWKDFPDYYARTKSNLVVPYVNINTQQKMDAMASTGSLGDYLNIPTTAFGEYGVAPTYGVGGFSVVTPVAFGSRSGGVTPINDWSEDNFPISAWPMYSDELATVKSKIADLNASLANRPLIFGKQSSDGTISQTLISAYGANKTGLLLTTLGTLPSVTGSRRVLRTCIALRKMADGANIMRSDGLVVLMHPDNIYSDPKQLDVQVVGALSNVSSTSVHSIPFVAYHTDGSQKIVNATISADFRDISDAVVLDIRFTFKSDDLPDGWSVNGYLGLLSHSGISTSYNCWSIASTTPVEGYYLDQNGSATTVLNQMVSNRPAVGMFGALPQTQWDASLKLSDLFEGPSAYPFNYVPGAPLEYDLQNSPWYSSLSPNNAKQIKLNAEPFRAYESIYNAFYRDERNNPYILNGQAEYNKWIPTQDGGEDDNIYRIRYRNWEQDFLTTAVQSPQQGIAPLVGIVSYNNQSSLAFVDQESGETFKANVSTADDGTVTKFDVERTDQPVQTFASLVDMVQSGISINDFRNVNALQRWLETNMRKGYRLKDIIKGHFDVNVRFDELDMPEFIGGVSEDIRTSMVTQTSADQEGSPLGSYAGQAVCVGTSKHTIRHYFDEPGYLIGILSVVPVPNYSQLLPKYFTETDVLDNYFPEFGHIGYQPITYKEVCPIQSYLAGQDVNDVFGYQRSWYQYLQNVDQVHGLFRTSLRDYLINRVFDKRPQLSESFLLVDPKQTNNVFTVTTENDDVFAGQVYYDFSMKSPIPLYGVPRLE